MENWSYHCSSTGSTGNFTTTNGFGAAAGTTDGDTNQLGASGTVRDHYHDTGTFSIDVNSECSWSITAVAIKP